MKKNQLSFLNHRTFLLVNCSTKIKLIKNSSANSNTQNNADSNADDARGSAVETNLGKVSPDQVVNELDKLHKKEKSPFHV